MIVTIDGPAGAGKTTVAKALARRLGFRFLDTGAMYRAVALAGLRHGVNWEEPSELAELATRLDIRFEGDRVLLDEVDVTEAIRTSETTAAIRYAADNERVRLVLVDRQRQFARHHDLVTEGRDQGTLVFPDARCKIFLSASPEERARRRVADMQARGEHLLLDDVLDQQQRRDEQDYRRNLGRLAKAPDAVEVVTDGMSLEEVVDRLEQIVRARADDCGATHPANET